MQLTIRHADCNDVQRLRKAIHEDLFALLWCSINIEMLLLRKISRDFKKQVILLLRFYSTYRDVLDIRARCIAFRYSLDFSRESHQRDKMHFIDILVLILFLRTFGKSVRSCFRKSRGYRFTWPRHKLDFT